MATKQNPYTRRNRPLCWICEENPADSQEHSIKASRIKQMEETLQAGENLLTPGKDGRVYPIRGRNSQVVKFGKTMCQKCNNERTKEFDKAYDRFVEFLTENYDYFRDKRQFSWGDIYSGYSFDQRHLQRYYLKNAGCRMIDAGAEGVPQELRSYLFDFDAIPDFSLVLYKDFETADLFNKMGDLNSILGENLETREPEPFLNPFANYATANQNGDAFKPGDDLFFFCSVLQDGPIGGMFQWHDPHIRQYPLISFNLNDIAFIRDRSEFDEQTKAFLGSWDIYTDVVRAGLNLVWMRREMADHTKQIEGIGNDDLVGMAAWYLKLKQLQDSAERRIREASHAVNKFRDFED
ncbi:hypothetical protein [Corynebacterium sp. J010B-136]|uniref:hypothetical protein n=1 Tax=Corynebacterium sp. J010B-136 TaxID=2099401 RepID=UPI000CFA33EC|nr:hypothetical protein [Corynebacterium sp. J010B-136]PQM75226.1 hypothetical protein C5Y44_00110 [Corynebacterium sp. J010B-136]